MRPSGQVWLAPLAQLTLQLPMLLHDTEQRPWQVMLQLPARAQFTVLPSPTTALQVLTSWQSYWQPRPHCTLHTDADLQLARQSLPQVALQFVPETQEYKQLSPHCAVQSAAPLQSGAQASSPRQS